MFLDHGSPSKAPLGFMVGMLGSSKNIYITLPIKYACIILLVFLILHFLLIKFTSSLCVALSKHHQKPSKTKVWVVFFGQHHFFKKFLTWSELVVQSRHSPDEVCHLVVNIF